MNREDEIQERVQHDAAAKKVARVLFMHDVSNFAGETVPEISDLCDDAARAVLAALTEDGA